MRFRKRLKLAPRTTTRSELIQRVAPQKRDSQNSESSRQWTAAIYDAPGIRMRGRDAHGDLRLPERATGTTGYPGADLTTDLIPGRTPPRSMTYHYYSLTAHGPLWLTETLGLDIFDTAQLCVSVRLMCAILRYHSIQCVATRGQRWRQNPN